MLIKTSPLFQVRFYRYIIPYDFFLCKACILIKECDYHVVISQQTQYQKAGNTYSMYVIMKIWHDQNNTKGDWRPLV